MIVTLPAPQVYLRKKQIAWNMELTSAIKGQSPQFEKENHHVLL